MTVASLALGQQCYGVTLRELTAGYTACATGCYRAPVSYHRVLDSHGNVLLSTPRVQAEEGRVLSEETAAIMTKMLEGVTEWGTAASYIHLQNTQGIAVAGKTGTTQNNCDRLFVSLWIFDTVPISKPLIFKAAFAGVLSNSAEV